jgi:hypothetical protein
MITIYLDESRHSDPDSYMVVAGFWGNENQWDALIPEWIAALGKRKALHMRTLRLNSTRGAKRARSFLARMGQLPYKHGLTPIYGAVKTSDYLEIVVNTKHEKEFPGYAVCITAVMQRLSKRIPAYQTIKIVCEIQKSYEEIACRTFRQVRAARPISEPSRPYFSSIEFIPKDSSVLTQPSDFLAYAIAEGHEDCESAKAKLCKPILGPTGKVIGLTLERSEIRRIIGKYKAIAAARGY